MSRVALCLVGAGVLAGCGWTSGGPAVVEAPAPVAAPSVPVAAPSAPVAAAPTPALAPAEPPLPACALPVEEMHGFLVVRANDVVVSTSAGELRSLVGGAIDDELRTRVTVGDHGQPWLVLGAPGIPESPVRALAARATAAGYRDVRACTGGTGVVVVADGSVTAPAAPGATGFLHHEGPEDTVEPEPELGGRYGSGSGGGFGGRPVTMARVRTGEPTIVGSLSSAVVVRVVRRHVNEIRFCYEQALAVTSTLAGRVELSWVVDAAGAVSSPAVASSTLGSPVAEACMLQATRRWTFPAPEGGGVARVTVPVVLDPGE